MISGQKRIYYISKFTIDKGQTWIGPLRKCELGTDEELDACLKAIVLDIAASTADGISEFDLEPLDPFKLGKFDYDEKVGPIKVQLRAKNVILHGMTKFKSIEFHVDTKNRLMNFEYDLPTVKIAAEYKLAGNAIIPLSGAGPADIQVCKWRYFEF